MGWGRGKLESWQSEGCYYGEGSSFRYTTYIRIRIRYIVALDQ